MGHVVVCLEVSPIAYRLEAVETDHFLAGRPWDANAYGAAVFPIQQIVALYPGPVKVKEGGMPEQTTCIGDCAIVIGGNQTRSKGALGFVGVSFGT